MFHFFRKRSNSYSTGKTLVFSNFVRGVWQALAEMGELDPDNWEQLQNVSNLCVLAWNCSLMECSIDEAKATIPEKLCNVFHCDDPNVADFVCQTMDFKYQNFADQRFIVLKCNISRNSGDRQIDVVLDDKE